MSNTLGSVIVDYGYDDVGKRTYVQRVHRPNQPFEVCEYDGLYQLINAWYGADAAAPAAISSYDLLQSYDLDLQGNRLAVTQDGATAVYGPHDGTQLTNVMNQYESADGLALGYDARGNTLTDGASVCAYDVLNRQTGVSNGKGDTEYIYDARGRCVAKVTGGVTTHYIYDAHYRVIEERDGNGPLASYRGRFGGELEYVGN